MARASNIYIVQNCNGDILAAFTVKYESQGWAKHYADENEIELQDLVRVRVKNGGDNPGILIDCPWENWSGND